MRDTVGEQQPPELVELIEPEEPVDSDVYVKSGEPVVSGELVELEDPIKPESPELVELIEPVLGELEDPVRPPEPALLIIPHSFNDSVVFTCYQKYSACWVFQLFL